MTDKERADNALEAAARRELIRRLEHPLKLAAQAAEKEKNKRRELYEKTLGDYSSYEAIQDAYGYDVINDAERDALLEALEKGEDIIESQITPAELAVKILREFCGRLRAEASSFEFDNLPPEEQVRRLEAHEKLKEEIRRRKA